MSRDMWDPEVYRRYADERARPFFELVGRVGAARPQYVVDAGCGPGEMTAELARRWPEARVHGFDSSPAMIAKAAGHATERLAFEVADLREWRPERPVDVLVSNAVLQWLPEHRELLPRWVDGLAPGGWLAFQVPGNFEAPTHATVRELCRSPAWRDRLGDLARYDPVGTPSEYLDLLAGLGCGVDAWETTYVHVLPGEDAAFNWVSGTALRPLFERLGEGPEREAFAADCRKVLGAAYPRRSYGTPFEFRRVFVVARRPPG
ncbi:trans-aconitate 2-methyltransferase [Spongiactinospora sp. TRM90649]|uniref:trans-aconitate 2-methyltransferase n=1 Tax=Spongiactinospora sp. TRM90649 TaxID=3031114 RepID=UPI0023F9B342|nr:trans-aconitate 2-methyltransferase [Spongiactinospora sp. TRM90649]MDF5754825.1 trans-aconitate 2-methyltransferase [Spongiactinospora sp. TRM90649]